MILNSRLPYEEIWKIEATWACKHTQIRRIWQMAMQRLECVPKRWEQTNVTGEHEQNDVNVRKRRESGAQDVLYHLYQGRWRGGLVEAGESNMGGEDYKE